MNMFNDNPITIDVNSKRNQKAENLMCTLLS